MIEIISILNLTHFWNNISILFNSDFVENFSWNSSTKFWEYSKLSVKYQIKSLSNSSYLTQYSSLLSLIQEFTIFFIIYSFSSLIISKDDAFWIHLENKLIFAFRSLFEKKTDYIFDFSDMLSKKNLLCCFRILYRFSDELLNFNAKVFLCLHKKTKSLDSKFMFQ